MADENKNKCEICHKIFTCRKNMYQHVRKVHKMEPSIKGTILCPVEECSVSVNTFEKLRIHLVVQHFIKIIKEEMTFPNKSAFLSWKEELERIQTVSYACDTFKVLHNGNKRTYLRCNRSGNYNSVATLRIPKAGGTCKMGKHCPATIELTETENVIKVIHFKTHVGHNIERKQLNMNEADKKEVTRKLAEGASLKSCKTSKKKSLSFKVNSHNVEKMNFICTECQLHCNMCDTCLHEYSCKCIDCYIHGNMCKQNNAQEINEPKQSNLKRKKKHEIELNPKHESNQTQSINTEQSKADHINGIKHRLTLGLNLIESSSLSTNNYNEIKRHLDKALSILQTGNSQTHAKAGEKEPINKKLPIPRLHSTNKIQKIIKTPVNKHCINYKQAILHTLDNNSEMLAISCEDDHSYVKI